MTHMRMERTGTSIADFDCITTEHHDISFGCRSKDSIDAY